MYGAVFENLRKWTSVFFPFLFPHPENVPLPLWRGALVPTTLHASTGCVRPSSPHLFPKLFSGQEPTILRPSALVAGQPLPNPTLRPPESEDSFGQTFGELRLVYWSFKITPRDYTPGQPLTPQTTGLMHQKYFMFPQMTCKTFKRSWVGLTKHFHISSSFSPLSFHFKQFRNFALKNQWNSEDCESVCCCYLAHHRNINGICSSADMLTFTCIFLFAVFLFKQVCMAYYYILLLQPPPPPKILSYLLCQV